MLPLTEQQIKAYKQIFPELANDQLETAVLYAMGIPEKNIAFSDLLLMPQFANALKE